MKNESYLKYLLSDNQSLKTYHQLHKAVGLDDIKRAMLLNVRAKGYAVPDHYYRLGNEYSFHGINKLSELFTIGLPRLADEYLEIHDGKAYVKGRCANDWQMLLPYIPPLLLAVSKIWRTFGPSDDLIGFAHKHLLPSLKHTAMLPPFLPEMEVFRNENAGLYDLHLHLNGAIETDLAWHDFIRYPEIVYSEILKAYHNGKVKEQIEQLTNVSDPEEFLHLFKTAGRLRNWLANKTILNISSNTGSFENLLTELTVSEDLAKVHPLKSMISDNASPLILESSLYAKILDFLVKNPNDDAVAGIFHYYLLILGLCNRLLVQQTDTFGFEQFQKYTSNNFREFSEKDYRQRFLQLSGNDLRYTRHIEGRFSPKDDIDQNIKLIGNIRYGFEFLQRQQKKDGIPESTISLIAHFIKKSDSGDNDIRHHKLRHELNRKADALIHLINSRSSYGNLIHGVDAAANELDTPPEVFAPSFRHMRENGIKHFTFHAGEDFFHVLSGMRAIYEAVDFLGLQAGDRIGHATAAGIDVAIWHKNIGERLWMRRGDYMDDLVFAYHLITEYKDKSLEHLLPIIAINAIRYASEIYPSVNNIHELIDAWRTRKEDPLTIDLNDIAKPYQYHHSKKYRKKASEIIVVDTYNIFGEKDLIHLQHLLLEYLHGKQIVIETLPTSNVFIGHHHGFETYHLYNWYKWSKNGIKVPTIVVGTDDCGIFATNIYNEYCHIYCMLVFDKGLSSHEAMNYIERLAHNAKVYAF